MTHLTVTLPADVDDARLISELRRLLTQTEEPQATLELMLTLRTTRSANRRPGRVGAPRALNAASEAQMVREYLNGEAATVLARRYTVTVATVMNAVRRAGYTSRHRGQGPNAEQPTAV